MGRGWVKVFYLYFNGMDILGSLHKVAWLVRMLRFLRDEKRRRMKRWLIRMMRIDPGSSRMRREIDPAFSYDGDREPSVQTPRGGVFTPIYIPPEKSKKVNTIDDHKQSRVTFLSFANAWTLAIRFC